MAELQRQALSPDNPWPGLDPFDEADREYFHGRVAESNELLRLVRREPLTVLFGRSGLGKTSLLNAGLFPLLREEDCLPVYVRLDHAEGAPSLREQVFRELQTACDAERVQAPRHAGDEALWSFFHRRDAEFWSARNRPVTPVVVFDQFEEIFTLGQDSDESRTRSVAFLAELGDLVENRPPEAVREALEADPTAARRFDFKRAAVKLVLSFREDFLAEMEGLRERMPSLMYNRFRLLAMSGAQAYEVITRAGGRLVDDDVARRILRLAWKNEPSPPVEPSDFPRIEIDPALLSVVCSELNHKRQQANLEQITPALLEGADREILSGFYERGMEGLDPRVRAFVEDELITDRGYRDSHDLEDARALPGVTSEALDALIRRRLLRVDERQSMRRVELTHDVLARVVKESRDLRRAREAEKAALAQQRRNRRNAALVGVGALVVIVLIVMAMRFALIAKRMLHEAKITRLMANADRLQDHAYDASLLVNVEAVRAAPTLETQAGLLRRFVSHPHLSAFLRGHRLAVNSVAFSPDGKRLASTSLDQAVILWDVNSRQPLAVEGSNDQVLDVALSPDGKRLAWTKFATVIVQDMDRRQPPATLQGHDQVRRVTFSPDGRRLASANSDGTVILLDVDNRKPLAWLEGRMGPVTGVRFSPDGKQLASASLFGTVILWDLGSSKPLATLQEHKGRVTDVGFSPDGKWLASASEDRTVILWDLGSSKPLATLGEHKDTVTGVAFSPDGKWLASASEDRTVILWDMYSGKPLATLEGHKDAVTSVAFSPDGKRLASAGRDRTVILWDMDDRKPPRAMLGAASDNVAFSPDGKRLASTNAYQIVILWDVDSGEPLARLEGNKKRVHGVAFSPDGKRLASATWDNTVILWDVASRKLLAMLEGHKDRVYGVAFSPDGKRLASASADETVILWDVNSRKLLTTLKGHHGLIYGVAFSPDGKLLASTSWDETVILWDVNGHQRLATLRGYRGPVYGVAFSPNGKRLASVNRLDRTVTLWDVDGRKRLATLEGHKDQVFSVAFSPDGQRLASTSKDGTVILWDVENRTLLATLEGHKEAVTGMAFSPDGKRLVSASRDGTVIPWEVDLDHVVADACRTANRNLTCEEWRNYIGADQPYRTTCETLPPPPETCE